MTTVASEKELTIRFTSLAQGKGRYRGLLDDVEVTDTSDDDEDVGSLARNSSNSMLRALGTAPAASGHPKPKSVKKAIAKHLSDNEMPPASSERKVTRVVKTRKHDSVMGEGLVASEELKREMQNDMECTADEGDTEEDAPAMSSPADIEDVRQVIRQKSKQRDAVEPREVPLREGSPDPRRLATYKPPLMGIDASFVPPQLALLNIDPDMWECFADALNAAIPRGSQEIENQIRRWNGDAFEDMGFHISLVSLDAGLSLSVSTR
ncbi:hypothetical protein EC988_004400 [Linderina pennispora]|nr:hypothetical protein EC988_004400 [Linderina pennispora]